MSGGAPRKVYPVPVRVTGVGRLPVEPYKAAIEDLLQPRQRKGRPRRLELTDSGWGLICGRVLDYMNDLLALEHGLPAKKTRGPREPEPWRGRALRFADCLNEAAALWRSMTPAEQDALLDAGLFDHEGDADGSEDDEVIVAACLPMLGEFAQNVPRALDLWDSRRSPPIRGFLSGLRRDLQRVGVKPMRRQPDADSPTVLARAAHELIRAYRSEFPNVADLLSRTGAGSPESMQEAVDEHLPRKQ